MIEGSGPVLVVDDEESMRQLIGSILDASELPHDDVNDGAAALKSLASRPYGAVILDLMMPLLDGFSVIRALAAKDPALLSRVIVLSAGGNEMLESVDRRVFAVLRKPFSPRDLVDSVHRCLRGATA